MAAARTSGGPAWRYRPRSICSEASGPPPAGGKARIGASPDRCRRQDYWDFADGQDRGSRERSCASPDPEPSRNTNARWTRLAALVGGDISVTKMRVHPDAPRREGIGWQSLRRQYRHRERRRKTERQRATVGQPDGVRSHLPARRQRYRQGKEALRTTRVRIRSSHNGQHRGRF